MGVSLNLKASRRLSLSASPQAERLTNKKELKKRKVYIMLNTSKENRRYLESLSQDLKDAYNNGNMIDYVGDNVLDVEYIINSSRELIGVKLYITLGGPTIWIDTENCTLNISWACESDTIGIYSDICDEITEIFGEYFNI